MHEYGEPLHIMWINFAKSRQDLGYNATKNYYQDILKRCQPSNRENIKKKLQEIENCQGKTILDQVYRSPYEAYPFLSDSSDDLRCDFELLTDEISSKTGLLLAHMKNRINGELYQEVMWVCELVYHINPSLRTFLSITVEECNRLKTCVDRLQ